LLHATVVGSPPRVVTELKVQLEALPTVAESVIEPLDVVTDDGVEAKPLTVGADIEAAATGNAPVLTPSTPAIPVINKAAVEAALPGHRSLRIATSAPIVSLPPSST
jgi:hypothetical protein